MHITHHIVQLVAQWQGRADQLQCGYIAVKAVLFVDISINYLMIIVNAFINLTLIYHNMLINTDIKIKALLIR